MTTKWYYAKAFCAMCGNETFVSCRKDIPFCKPSCQDKWLKWHKIVHEPEVCYAKD